MGKGSMRGQIYQGRGSQGHNANSIHLGGGPAPGSYGYGALLSSGHVLTQGLPSAPPHLAGVGAGRRQPGKKKGGGGGQGSHQQPQITEKAVRRAAAAGRADEALTGFNHLVHAGRIDTQTFQMVGIVAVKAGRLRALSEAAKLAGTKLGGRPLIQLAILHTIVSSLTIHCVKEAGEDGHCVGDLVQHLTACTDFTEGEQFRRYYARLATGLMHEYIDEASGALERTRNVAVDALVRMGSCHADVTCTAGLKSGEVKCQLPMGSGAVDERRGISGGDLLAFLPYPAQGYENPTPIEAEVAVVLSREIIVKLTEQEDQDKLLAPGRRWRMDKMANKVALVRQLKALRVVCGSVGGGAGGGSGGGKSKKGGKIRARPAEQIVLALTTPAPQPGLGQPAVVQAASTVCVQGGGLYGRPLQPPPSGSAAVAGLNPSQARAICGAVTRRLTLVQGPPGTGKTHTALRILHWWLRSMAHGSGPVLATSDSNIAVDNLLEGLVKMGVRVVRLGRPDRVRPELLQYCVDVPPPGQMQVDWGAKMAALRQAQVVCSTCVGVGSDQLDGFTFAGVLLDEASQVTEASSIVPLCRGCEQLVLVGDQCQLPPTVASQRALDVGFGEPLFNRLVSLGVTPLLLDTQYRMHPAISQFPSDLFYGGRIADGIGAEARPALPGFQWPRPDWPVAFVPMTHGQETSEGLSKFNHEEANAVVQVVNGFLAAGLPPGEIGVVTPYAAQVRVIRRMFPRASPGERGVEVSSVDGFQGREKEVIVMSTVRASVAGGVGFLADWRRVNVAFTRPRRGLVVLGHPETLARDKETWGRWLQWVSAQGVNVRDPVPRGQLDRAALQAACKANQMLPATVTATELTEMREGDPVPPPQQYAAQPPPDLQAQTTARAQASAAYGQGQPAYNGCAHFANGYPMHTQASGYVAASQGPGSGSTMAALMSGDWNALMSSTSGSLPPTGGAQGPVTPWAAVVGGHQHTHPLPPRPSEHPPPPPADRPPPPLPTDPPPPLEPSPAHVPVAAPCASGPDGAAWASGGGQGGGGSAAGTRKRKNRWDVAQEQAEAEKGSTKAFKTEGGDAVAVGIKLKDDNEQQGGQAVADKTADAAAAVANCTSLAFSWRGSAVKKP